MQPYGLGHAAVQRGVYPLLIIAWGGFLPPHFLAILR